MSKTNPRDKIITLPNPKLREKSARVHIINEDTLKLIEEMKKSTLDWEDSRGHEVGVALAAVQIAEMYKVVIIRDDFEDKKNREFGVLINPEIVKYEGEEVEDFEGCLSIKDVYGKVKRWSKVRVKAKNLKGVDIRLKAEGFLARVMQHEIDHTNGVVFVDHLKDQPEKLYTLSKSGEITKLEGQELDDAIHLLW